ncbi:MAG TPA: isoprenylcysteine carboxylmethyltransferase family protein [Planctomycetota bacterium]|nr:isoprenylcysteine carboxylmethyltransferase family protein [Planctomycetota bacterium]
MRVGRVHRGLLACGRFFFKYRNLAFPLVSLVLVVLSRPWVPGDDPRIAVGFTVAGIVLAAVGETWRILVVGLVYIKRGGKKKKVYADTLVQEGIFAHSRNPIYLGNLLILVGLTVVYHSALFAAVGVPFYLFAYWTIILAEEDYLRGRFGDAYDDYCRRVNRLFPSLKGLGRTMRSMPFNWKRLANKEYSTLCSFLTMLLGLVGWKQVVLYGYEASVPTLLLLGALWVPVLVLVIVIKVLKVRGRLSYR